MSSGEAMIIHLIDGLKKKDIVKWIYKNVSIIS